MIPPSYFFKDLYAQAWTEPDPPPPAEAQTPRGRIRLALGPWLAWPSPLRPARA